MRKIPIVQGYKKPPTPMWGGRCPCLTTEMAHRTNSFGLPQKTKLRLSSAPRALKSQAYRLRKRGYTIDYATKTAFYDENTNRCFLLEGKKRGEYRAKGRRWGRLFFDFKPAASSQAQRASAL